LRFHSVVVVTATVLVVTVVVATVVEAVVVVAMAVVAELVVDGVAGMKTTLLLSVFDIAHAHIFQNNVS
jgi:hypothetical protein